MKNRFVYIQFALFCAVFTTSYISFGAASSSSGPSLTFQQGEKPEQRVQKALEAVRPEMLVDVMCNAAQRDAFIKCILDYNLFITPAVMRRIANLYTGRTGIFNWTHEKDGIVYNEGRYQGVSLKAIRAAAEYFKNIPQTFPQTDSRTKMEIENISHNLAAKFSNYADFIEKTIQTLSNELDPKPLFDFRRREKDNYEGHKDTVEANTLDLLLNLATKQMNFKAIDQLLAAGADSGSVATSYIETPLDIIERADMAPETKRDLIKKLIPSVRGTILIPAPLYRMFIASGDAETVALLIKKDDFFLNISMDEDDWQNMQREVLSEVLRCQQPIILAQFIDAGARANLNQALMDAIAILYESQNRSAEDCVKILLALGATSNNPEHAKTIEILKEDPEVREMATDVPRGALTKYLVNAKNKKSSLVEIMCKHLA